MYCNLCYYIVIAIVHSDHRRKFFNTVWQKVWAAMPGAERFPSCLSNASQCLIN